MSTSENLPIVYLIRHGQTAWSVSGRHTGLTDLPLMSNGQAAPRLLGTRLRKIPFTQVYTSPLRRATRTCEKELAGEQYSPEFVGLVVYAMLRLLFIRRLCMGKSLRSASMIELYYWPTPNGHKITLFLEETGLTYQIVPLDISKGEQFRPEFLAFSPNNRMPAIIDRAPADDGEAVGVFESGAILVYLAEKSGMLLPADLRGRKAAMEWLFWQVGGLGPMAGQNHHFNHYAPEKILYAIERYVKETNRLYGVLDRRLAAVPYLAGEDYSIADIAVYPWIVPWERQSQDLGHFPALKRWFDAIAARPATVRAYERGAALKTQPVVRDDSRKILFGQTALPGR